MDDKNFIQDFNLLVHHLETFEPIDLVWWENFKIQTKDLIIKHSKIQSAKHKTHIQDLENCLQLLKLQKLQAEGIKIRSKLLYIEENENPSKYLKKFEKSRNKQKTIDSLIINDHHVSDQTFIRAETLKYYKSLYSKTETNKEFRHQFTNNLPKLTPDDNDLLEGPITYEECQAAMKSFENNKSPGIDGLPKEFY